MTPAPTTPSGDASYRRRSGSEADGNDREGDQYRGELERHLRRGVAGAEQQLAQRLARIERHHVPGEDRAARGRVCAIVQPAFDADEDARDADAVDEPQGTPQGRLLDQRIGERAGG